MVRRVLLFAVIVGLCLLLMYNGELHGVGCCLLIDGCWLIAMVRCMSLVVVCCCCGLLRIVSYLWLYVGDACCHKSLHVVAMRLFSCCVLLLVVVDACCSVVALCALFQCAMCWLACCSKCCLLLLWPCCCCLLVWLVSVAFWCVCFVGVGWCLVLTVDCCCC